MFSSVIVLGEKEILSENVGVEIGTKNWDTLSDPAGRMTQIVPLINCNKTSCNAWRHLPCMFTKLLKHFHDAGLWVALQQCSSWCSELARPDTLYNVRS